MTDRAVAGLHPNERLKKRNAIARLYNDGKVLRGRNMNSIWLRSQSRKVGFTSTRLRLGAVARNRIKRRLREAFRQQKQLFDRRHHYLFVGKAGILTCKMQFILSEMAAMAGKIAHREKDSS